MPTDLTAMAVKCMFCMGREGTAYMDQKGQIIEKAEALRDSVGKTLKNRLCYPKTVITLLGDGKLGKDQVAKMVDGIHESIKVVDAKFIEFIEELKSL